MNLFSSGGVSFQWTPEVGLNNPALNNPVASPLKTTTYTVRVIDSNSCISVDSVQIKVFPELIIQVSKDTAVCGSGNVPLFVKGGEKYQWSPSIGLSNSTIANPIASPSVSTIYSVKVTDVNNCMAYKSVSLTVLPLPKIEIVNDTTVCRFGNVQLYASGGYSYQWIPATGLNNASIQNPVASIESSMVYRVFITGPNNCKNSDSVVIDLRPAPQFGVKSNISGCAGVPVILEAFGGSQYQWYPTTGLSNPNISNPVALLQESENYSVRISDPVCKESASFDVPVSIKTLQSLVISKTNDISCNTPFSTLSANRKGLSYLWTPQNFLSDPFSYNPVASPVVTSVYTLSMVDSSGCIATGSVELKVVNNGDFRLYQLPNAFTPDGDSKNDCFGVSKWGNIEIQYFQVFNRWGQLIFNGANKNQCWDGKLNGIPQPSGNYVYRLKAQTSCGIVERSGNVVLIR
jgi:gliding motility-associated-like protein